MKENRHIRVCVLNIKEVYEAIRGEQCIKGAYTEDEVLKSASEHIKTNIDDLGLNILYNDPYDSIQLLVAKDWDKVYCLDIVDVIPRNYDIIIHLHFNGFLK